MKNDEYTKTIKEPDIAKGVIENDQHRLPYTGSNDKSIIIIKNEKGNQASKK